MTSRVNSNEMSVSKRCVLYGVAGPDYDNSSASWVEPGSSNVGESGSFRHATRKVSADGVLLYMDVTPKGGARGILLQQADGLATGPNDELQKLEVTDLEVYTSPKGGGFFLTL